MKETLIEYKTANHPCRDTNQIIYCDIKNPFYLVGAEALKLIKQ